jgi:hypothetical protein
VRKDAQVLDIGLDLKRKLGSTFYRAEVAFLQSKGYVRRFSHLEMLNGQTVIVWKWVPK